MPIGAVAPSALTTEQKQRSKLSDYIWLKTGRELIEGLFTKMDQYRSFLERSGKLSTWKRVYKNYYLGGMENARLRQGGDKNQFVMAQVNHFANILGHMLNNVTQNRPNLKARAQNGDFKSLAQTKVGDQVLEYYLDEKGLEDSSKDVAELGLLFGEAELMELWDATLGEDVAAQVDETTGEQTGGTEKQGDIVFDVFAPMDVAKDFTVGRPDDGLWKITRKLVNRWDLAAKFPQYETEILTVSSSPSNMRRQRIGHASFEPDDDQIFLYVGIHKKCSVIPDGRLLVFIDNSDVTLIDSPLPHKKILHRLAPREQHGTVFGYSVAFDLLPIQENINMLYSIIASNQAMFGVQSLLVAKGSGIEYSALQGGLKIVEYDAKPGVDTKPSVLQLTSTPAEIFKHIDHLILQMETISGVNSVVRGQPEASLESGAALALVASQSIQFMSSFQQAYTRLLESAGTGVLDILKEFAKAPRMVAIVGKQNVQYLPEFVGDDISQIDRVTAEVNNPLARTTSGKLQIAQDLLSKQLIDAKQYLTILETGSLEQATQAMSSQLLLIKEENERLLKGEQIPALQTDLHMLHIAEHASVLANIDARFKPNVVDAVSQHIQQHEQLLMGLSPIMAGATNQPILNAGAQQGGGGAGGPPGPNAPPPPAGPPSEVINPTNPVQAQANAVKQPNMPQNPLSGQPFNPTTGGM
jgi:hypothetical protein